MIGAWLLEHLVEEIGTSGRFPRVLVLSGGDKVHVGGVCLSFRKMASTASWPEANLVAMSISSLALVGVL
jgi:hypothetical protein